MCEGYSNDKGFLFPESLFDLSAKVFFKYFVKHDTFDTEILPDPIAFNLLYQCSEADDTKKLLYKKFDLIVFMRLSKYERYRLDLMKFYQSLIDQEHPIGKDYVNTFMMMSMEAVNSNDNDRIIKHIRNGLRLGSFLSEGSWYFESEQILRLTKNLSHMLPKTVLSYKLKLECCHRLFHTLTMYYKFDEASKIYNEITSLMSTLGQYGEYPNYAILYTEFSKFSFLKSNYEESYNWTKKAIYCLNSTTAIPTQIQVLRQASKVCVVKRDFVKAEFLILQALVRAKSYYGLNHYKMASLFQDYGFYLLNSDKIAESAGHYEEAYKMRVEVFGSSRRNLNVAIAEEDLAYVLYVYEYSIGGFFDAMVHAEQAISAMTALLPEGNLMLSSANRVKALILEEMALDNFMNHSQTEVTKMLEEAEKLHQDALSLTERTFGEENTLTAKHYGNLGRLYQSMARYEEAEKMHLKAIQIKEKILGPNDYEVGLSVGHLASLYNYHMQEFKKAEELYYRSISINLKLFSESYSGLEYDYRGLIHVYENLKNNAGVHKFSSKLCEWKQLRDKSAMNSRDAVIPAPVQSIIDLFENNSTSTA